MIFVDSLDEIRQNNLGFCIFLPCLIPRKYSSVLKHTADVLGSVEPDSNNSAIVDEISSQVILLLPLIDSPIERQTNILPDVSNLFLLLLGARNDIG